MPDYPDVPTRLANGENVARSEILAYWGDGYFLQVTYGLEALVTAYIMEKVYEDDTLYFRLTSLGMNIRRDLVTRLEGDCPECEECP